METSLHRQLKEAYAGPHARFEVPLDAFRIDVVNGRQLVEIQHGSLAAIRRKLESLLPEHRLLVVKPIIAAKRLIKLDRKDGEPVSRRASPKRGSILEVFDELVYLTQVFPHPNLTLEVPLVEIEEWRYPGHGRRRRRRRADFQIQDQQLVDIREKHRFRHPRDFAALVPAGLPRRFDTQILADHLSISRWVAQRIAYCLRETGAIRQVAKQRNALVYEFARRRRKRAA